MESNIKFKIKAGEVEVEYEGSQDYDREALIELVSKISVLAKGRFVQIIPEELHEKSVAKVMQKNLVGGDYSSWSTSSWAKKMGAKSGIMLMLAACAKIALTDGKEQFSAKEIHAEMKTAAGWYKDSYRSNFSNYLQANVRSGKLVLGKGGSYSISHEKSEELKAAYAIPQ